MYKNYSLIDTNNKNTYNIQQQQQQQSNSNDYHQYHQQQQAVINNSNSAKRAFYRANRPGDIQIIDNIGNDNNAHLQYTNTTPTYTPTPTTPYQQQQQHHTSPQYSQYVGSNTQQYNTTNSTTTYQNGNRTYNNTYTSPVYQKQPSYQQQQQQPCSTPNYSPCYNSSAHMIKQQQQQYFKFDFVEPQQRPQQSQQPPQSPVQKYYQQSYQIPTSPMMVNSNTSNTVTSVPQQFNFNNNNSTNNHHKSVPNSPFQYQPTTSIPQSPHVLMPQVTTPVPQQPPPPYQQVELQDDQNDDPLVSMIEVDDQMVINNIHIDPTDLDDQAVSGDEDEENDDNNVQHSGVVDDELITNTPTTSLQHYPHKDDHQTTVINQTQQPSQDLQMTQTQMHQFHEDNANMFNSTSTNNNNRGNHDSDITKSYKQKIKTSPQHLSMNDQMTSNIQSHNNNNNIQRCIECGKSFTNKSALAKHRLIHSNDRKYTCAICDKSFKRQDHLNGHMLTHQDKKPFQCKVPNCEKSYCDSRSLKRHVESQHQEYLASLVHGRIEALNYLPPIGKIKANIGTNIQQTIVIDSLLNVNDASCSSTTSLPVIAGIDSNSNQQYIQPPPMTSTQASSSLQNEGSKKDYNSTKNFFTFEEPKSEICKICGKGFKNTHALNGHMRQHGGYTKPKQVTSQNSSNNKKPESNYNHQQTNKQNNNFNIFQMKNDDSNSNGFPSTSNANDHQLVNSRDSLIEKLKTRHVTNKSQKIQDIDFNLNQNNQQYQQQYHNNSHNSHNNNKRNIDENNNFDIYNQNLVSNIRGLFNEDRANSPWSIHTTKQQSTSVASSVHSIKTEAHSYSPQQKRVKLINDDSLPESLPPPITELNKIHLNVNNNNNKISKPKPKPIEIPSTISNFSLMYPQMTLLKSPHFNFETSIKSQYTPPPMLSPFRKGPGLFLNATNRQHVFSLPLSRQLSQYSQYLMTGNNLNITAQLIPPSSFVDTKTTGSVSASVKPDSFVPFPNQTPKPSLLRSRINSFTSSTGSFFAEETPQTNEMQSEPSEDIIKPFINIGPDFQAKLPQLRTNEKLDKTEIKEDLLWNGNLLERVPDDQFKDYLELCCKSSLVNGSSDNLELCLHVLNYLNGDVKKAIKCFIDGTCDLESSNPITNYKYAETDIWSNDEIKLFENAILKYDKSFSEISKEITTKTTKECIEFYYLWKKVMSDTMKKKWRSFKRKRKSDTIEYSLRSNKLDDLTNDLATNNFNIDDNFVDKQQTRNINSEVENVSISSDDLDATKSNLKNNANVNTSKARYQCKQCNLVFKSEQKLRSHDVLKHNIVTTACY